MEGALMKTGKPGALPGFLVPHYPRKSYGGPGSFLHGYSGSLIPELWSLVNRRSLNTLHCSNFALSKSIESAHFTLYIIEESS
jgi:hypothetical protein